MNSTLTTTYKAASHGLRDQLIMENIDYVGRILSTMNFRLEDPDAKENLHSAGMLGLVEAATQFDPSRCVPFRTFAYRRIKGAIVDELRSVSPLSQAMLKNVGRVRRVIETLEPPVSPEVIAEQTGMTLEQVSSTLEAMRFTAPSDWNDLSDEIHSIWTQSDDVAERDAELEELSELLADAIEQLDDRDRLVLTLYYKEELNMAEIGAAMDLSESRVSRILSEGRFRLQEIVRCKTQ